MAARWVFILSIPLLLLTASIALAVNSAWLYGCGFDKYGVSSTTGLAPAELEKAAGGLISYFNSGEDYIGLTVIKDGEPFVLFNEREVVHLRDVKALIRLDYRVLLGALVYALGYALTSLLWRRRRYWRQLAGGLVRGSGLTLVLMLVLGVGVLFNFEQLFLQFHLLSFANDFWLLNPATDYLIMLFPGGFWYDATVFCAAVTALGVVVLGGAGYLLIRKSRAKS